MRLHQYSQTYNPYGGVAESGVTSNYIFLGDAVPDTVTWSLTTSSGTASVWTIRGSDDPDGFRTAIVAGSLHTIAAASLQGFYSLNTLTRWIQFQRTPSASSSTVQLAFKVGG